MNIENEKSYVEKLTEELLINRKNGFMDVTDEQIEKADQFCEGYKNFLNKAKTEREAVTVTIAYAEKNGFVPFNRDVTYQPGDKIYYNNRDKSLILAVIGKDGCKNGVRMAAAHIDSPRLDLKPYPMYEANDLVLFKSHYYGGLKKYQWTTIPLSMHGRVVRRDGTFVDICLGEEPCYLILVQNKWAKYCLKPLKVKI